MKAIILVLLAACSPMSYDHGVPNLSQVDGHVWRSGQIATAEGWDYVRYLVRPAALQIIKLNFADEAMVGGVDGDTVAEDMGIPVHRIPIQPAGDQGAWQDVVDVFTRPDASAIAEAERLLADPSVTWLVHCTHGQDRTGLVVGEHRVLHDGWRPRDAFREMTDHNFHPELVGLLLTWLEFAP